MKREKKKGIRTHPRVERFNATEQKKVSSNKNQWKNPKRTKKGKQNLFCFEYLRYNIGKRKEKDKERIIIRREF